MTELKSSNDDATSAKAFHESLSSVSPAYVAYAAIRSELWRDAGFQLATPRLGRAKDYSTHYATHLLPLLRDHFDVKATDGKGHIVGEGSLHPLKFLDLGSAPGGLCHALLESWTSTTSSSQWRGVGVTLDPKEGGLPMQVTSPRLEVRFADVTQREPFVDACVATSGLEDGTYDLVNLGIVLDHTVRVKRRDHQRIDGSDTTTTTTTTSSSPPPPPVSISYAEQLYTQLLVAQRALKRDGTGVLMLAMKTDFPSLPESLPSLARLMQSTQPGGVRVIPTMYTLATGKKQFYVVCLGCRIEMSLCDDLRRIWNLGTMRYLSLKRAAIAEKESRRKRDRCGEDEPQGEGGGAATEIAKLDTLPATVVECNGYDATATVRSLYGEFESNDDGDGVLLKKNNTGRDLDVFFTMVRTSLEQQSGVTRHRQVQ